MRIMLLLLGLLATGQVTAQTVYRCVGKAGAITFKSQPCNPLERTTKVVHDYVRDDPDAARRRNRIEAEMDRRNTQASNYGQIIYTGNAEAANRQRSGCAAARQHRAAVLERVGLRRTFDLLRSLDDQVYRACR